MVREEALAPRNPQLESTTRVHDPRGDSDDDRDRDDAAAPTDLEVGRVDPEIGPVAFEGPVEGGLHLAVDLFAQP